MFRHRGKARTHVHNLKLASLLSFVAGIVNISGFLSVQQMTTNVTGHFAYIGDEIVTHHFFTSFISLLYILCFLTGAFSSNLLIELTTKINQRYVNAIPVFAEIILLTIIALLSLDMVHKYAESIACALLFAMGLQNAMVTKISNSVVRTTHLTGLFTDLGIELSQLFFYRRPDHLAQLKASIKLRFAIIGFFFLGCVLGGVGYLRYNTEILFLAVLCLFIGIIYADLRYRYLLLKKKRSW